MRSYETARQLSYESFIETFGKVPVDSSKDFKPVVKRRSMFVRPKEVASILKTQGTKVATNTQEQVHDSASDTNNNAVTSEGMVGSNNQAFVTSHKETRVERMSRKFRKISLRKRDASKGGSADRKKASLHRSKSVSFLGKSACGNRLSTFNPISGGRKSPVLDGSETPMSKMNSAAHRGYLSKKDEKRNSWIRYWCILQDSCLYCYSTPNSDFADDVIALGGYYVMSRFSGLNLQSSPTVALERPEHESYEFKGDNQKEQNEWIMALKGDILIGKRSSAVLKRSTSLLQPSTLKQIVPKYQRAKTDTDTVSRAKAKLLGDILAQQKCILREQIALKKLSISRESFTVSTNTVNEVRCKTPSVSSSTQSEDHGYCSSLDISMQDNFTDLDDSNNSRQNSPSNARSFRSMSTVSVASSGSLCSIAEEKQKPAEISPRVLAEIEEFRSFSKKTIEERRPKNLI
ncbi:uncharacterized protein LOC120326944 [Styela clava]